jgi:MoxR-like ATPase
MALDIEVNVGEIDSSFDVYLDELLGSPEKILKGLASVGYITDMPTAYAVWYAYDQNLPLLQEGPPGAGKTVLSTSIQKLTGMELHRLQCYEGITNKDAFGDWNKPLQDLYTLANRGREISSVEQIKKETFSFNFFNAGALLKSIMSNRRSILLIDEVDKVPSAFEAMLLELTGEWQISDRDFGTFEAITKPLVILTSNATRELGDALRRRSSTIFVKHPTPELEAKVIAMQAPDLPLQTKLFIAGFAKALRVEARMEKPPSISEMKHVARAMQKLKLAELRGEHCELFLPLIAKRENDINKMRKENQFGYLVNLAKKYAREIDPKSLEMDAPPNLETGEPSEQEKVNA